MKQWSLRFDTIDSELRITVSIGVALSNSDEETSPNFKRADKALYRAKEEGRNRCMFDDTPHESIDTEKDMTS